MTLLLIRELKTTYLCLLETDHLDSDIFHRHSGMLLVILRLNANSVVKVQSLIKCTDTIGFYKRRCSYNLPMLCSNQ